MSFLDQASKAVFLLILSGVKVGCISWALEIRHVHRDCPGVKFWIQSPSLGLDQRSQTCLESDLCGESLMSGLWAGLCWMVSKAYNLNAFASLFKPQYSRLGEFSFIWNVNNSVLRLWLDWVMQLRSISFVHSSIYKIQLFVSNASKCWKLAIWNFS